MELNLGIERPQRQSNGRFLPGHKSPIKGIPRTTWMSEEKDMRLREIGAKRFCELGRSENSGRPKRKVVLVTDDGRFCVFPSVAEGARKIGNALAANVGKCCRKNASRRVKTRTWMGSRVKGDKGVSKAEGSLVNTDHKYVGFRWYFEDDDIWTTKIRQL